METIIQIKFKNKLIEIEVLLWSNLVRSSNILQRLEELKKSMSLPQSYRPQESQQEKFDKYLP